MIYRLSKYNPAYRNNEGAYRKNEWTSICDIGTEYDDGILTVSTYLKVEESYCKVVKAILEKYSESSFSIQRVERYVDTTSASLIVNKYGIDFSINDIFHFNAIKQNHKISIDEVEFYLKFLLRELVWYVLVGKEISITVGHDYYVHLQSKNPLETFEDYVANEGLYLERI